MSTTNSNATHSYPKVPFWDRIAEKYAKSPIEFPDDYERKLEITRKYLQPDMELLEFGCGTGSTALLHAPRVAHIRAVDISSKMIEIAQGKAEAQGVSNVSFEVAKFSDLAVPDSQYDMVLGLSILHLLPDMNSTLAEVYRMLKPGGYFVSSTACIADHMKWFRFIAPVGRFFRVFPYVRTISEAELLSAVEGAGLAIEHHWRPSIKQGVFVIGQKPQ